MNRGFQGLGIRLLSCDPADDFIGLARFAEEYGFASFWVTEFYHFLGMFALLGAVAQATKRISLVTTVANPFTRHPCLIAMEMAALDELSHQRAILTLGVGRRYIVHRHGTPDTQPMKGATAVRESVQIIRGMFAGKVGTFEGKVFTARDVPFRPLHKSIPIYIAGINPKMLELAGEVADGLSLTPLGTPSYIRYALEQAKRGASKANRDPSAVHITQGVLISVSDDYDAAMASAKSKVAFLVAGAARDLGSEEILLRYAGVKEDEVNAIVNAYEKGGINAAIPEVSDNVAKTFLAVGDPRSCTEHLKERVDAGVESLSVINVSPTIDSALPFRKTNSWRLISDHILPELRDAVK
ncbi:MAG: LLM class flavin-dependent oxidoreductase [Ignavibacteriae bacterium]|nr:LLM class flavin-dependent oxidoreductase [Ignavibacteriota bacterium]